MLEQAAYNPGQLHFWRVLPHESAAVLSDEQKGAKMKNHIPQNNVNWNYEGLLKSFIGQLREAEQDNIISIFLTGSFARGEAAAGSDLDLWCIFKSLNTDILNTIGKITRSLFVSYSHLEVNAQCLTLEEFNSGYFAKFLAYPIIYLEAVLLYGDDIVARALRDSEIEKAYKEFMAEVLLSIRHYIAVNEPAEKLTFQKIKTWVLKPLMFALRLERYLHTRQYPLTSKNLLQAYKIPPMSVLYFTNEEKWEADIYADRDSVLYALHDEVSNILTKGL